MKVVDLAFVCYAVPGIKAGQAFYETVLKLAPTNTWASPDSDNGFVEYDIGAATLAIGCGAPSFKPGTGTNVVAALEVEDFAAAVAHLKAQSVKFTMEPQETPVCQMALIEDPFGNPIMIHKRKAVA